MIRFTCPTCGRDYHLPEALVGLPLLCKGCGQRLEVPDASTVPDPPAEAAPEEQQEPAGGGRKPPESVPASPPEPEGTGPRPADPPVADPPPAAGERRALGVAADVAVGVLLAGLGMLLGQFATGRGTADILREAGSAPKFPPLDLVLWLGCVAAPVLGYVLFANRGKSVGAWLRTR